MSSSKKIPCGAILMLVTGGNLLLSKIFFRQWKIVFHPLEIIIYLQKDEKIKMKNVGFTWKDVRATHQC